MKKIILKKVSTYKENKKKRIKKIIIEFEWELKQQKAFETIKHNILTRCITIDNLNFQYHLVIDDFITSLKNCLFQLINVSKKFVWNSKLLNNFKIVMFMSFQLLSIETRYQIIERNCYIVIKNLEKNK